MTHKVHTAILLLASLTLSLLPPSQARAEALGTWRNHLAYYELQQVNVASGGTIFAVASDNLYSYNTTDGLLSTFSKAGELSDVGIEHSQWCSAAKRLVVVYDNGNIDLVSRDGEVTNISDYYSYTTTLDKQVNSITIDGRFAYLSTNFGIVKLDVQNATIADTYNLGQKVNDVCLKDGYIFAATRSGLYRATTADNLLDKSVWTQVSPYNFTCIVQLGSDLVVCEPSFISLMGEDGIIQRRVVQGVTFSSFRKTAGRLFCLGAAQTYELLSANGDEAIILNHQTSAIDYDTTTSTYWAQDDNGRLAQFSRSSDGTLAASGISVRPEGPHYNNFGFLKHAEGKLYGTCKTEDAAAYVQIYDNRADTWNVYDDSFKSSLSNRYASSYTIDVDPTDTAHVLMGAASGLYEFRSGEMVKHYNYQNSPLQPALGVSEASWKNYTKVGTLCFDSEGTAWCINTESATTSLFKFQDGSLTSLHHPDLITPQGFCISRATAMGQDSQGRIWFTNYDYRLSCVACYWPETDSLRIISDFVNQDGTSYTMESVFCWAEDRDGNIWIGTNQGPFMLEMSNFLAGDNTFTQVKVPRNDGTNLADYLLEGVAIRGIAIDGAGRKWFASGNSGAYLISADNMEQLEHFTTDNSPLLSNEVASVAIDQQTGEVFFGTSKGLCSYQADATAPADELSKDNVWAYPNPVRPDYSGLVTITGLTYNADVRILTANGRLVASGHSNGGTFTWDCLDLRGKRVASGVYMVCAATEDGSQGVVCKIAVVN